MVRCDRKLSVAPARKRRLAACAQAAFRAVLNKLADAVGGHARHGRRAMGG